MTKLYCPKCDKIIEYEIFGNTIIIEHWKCEVCGEQLEIMGE